MRKKASIKAKGPGGLQVLILAAGYATRLYPLTKVYPKPLLKVKGRPIIDYIIDQLNLIDGLDEIIVVTNSKFIGKFSQWRKSKRGTKPVVLIDDETKTNETRLGAIGDMAFVLKNHPVTGDLLVIGGDNLFNESIDSFLACARSRKESPAMGVYDIGSKEHAAKYGVIKLNKSSRVVDFQEKPERPASTLVAMCLYYFPKSKVKLINEYLESRAHKSDAMGFYIDWLRKRCAVYGNIFKGRWYDIGDRAFFDEARNKFTGKENGSNK